MTKASGRKAHSNGAALEKYLENIHFRAGVASGSDAEWTDASSAADALRRYLNDDMCL